MKSLNPYFSREEFECKCGECGQDTVDAELLKVLTDLRVYFGAPVYINSANRCEEHNKKVGGSPRSQHLTSKAADIRVKGHPPLEVYKYLDKEYPDTYGIGLYRSFVHIDVREGKSRWNVN